MQPQFKNRQNARISGASLPWRKGTENSVRLESSLSFRISLPPHLRLKVTTPNVKGGPSENGQWSTLTLCKHLG